MPYITNQQANTGSYLGTTQAWDISVIYQTDINSPEFKELIVKLSTTMNNMALVLNTKTTGLYLNQEFQTGQLFYPSTDEVNDQLTQRPIYRKVIDCGTLPDTGITLTPHNIGQDANYSFIKIYGASYEPASLTALPLPFISGSPIYLYLTATDVCIQTTSNRNQFTKTFVTVEYIKS